MHGLQVLIGAFLYPLKKEINFSRIFIHMCLQQGISDRKEIQLDGFDKAKKYTVQEIKDRNA